MVADIEELETLEGNITPKRCEHFIFPIADGTATLSGREYGVRESSPSRDQLVRSEDLREDRQGHSENSQLIDETKDDAEARTCRKKRHFQSH